MITGKNDHPGYSCERTQWVLFTGVGPLNFMTPTGLNDFRMRNAKSRLKRSALFYRPTQSQKQGKRNPTGIFLKHEFRHALTGIAA
jgi:hypothetical protein